MAIYNIVKKEETVLREKSKYVKNITKNVEKLLDNMAETMYESKGVGLAAPQVGVLKRVVVIDVGEGLIELINPEIIDSKGSETDYEGCLSCPGIVGEVTRAKEVKVKGLDRKGNEVIIEGDELLARCLQHEIDHLEGILFIDKAQKIQTTP
ncbi:peptide deformylase [Desulfonispora thiosulfatigenes DSM 11270]|uniref:Peptide deformylase n=1 Tax=Desulfonispora thiosulfatigenes DSM 11270 TaxID=656914 RepID=A0A1W1VJI2_DESTI|nr:peptide deformylase [Desulfonispora thiosulfatigenes]SMB93390.1 peptide deformylase [Desulfonispora thiosulfatigenes DSM 11270]